MMSENDQMQEKLYHHPNSRQSIQVDPVANKILLRKEMDYYNLNVFRWLKEHPSPYIPLIEQYYESDGHLIVYEEFIEGITLDELISANRLSDERKREIILEIMSGIEFLHRAKPPIIHRDLKAANILIANDGSVKILDYDAAKVYKANEKKDTVLIGTEGSAAPEQYGFGASDQRTDIYALGILLKRMFDHDTQILNVAEKAIRLDPQDRYQNIEEMRKAFLGKEKKKWIPEPYRRFIPPGFRTGTPWKMIVALLGYTMIFYLSITFVVNNEKTGEPYSGYVLDVYRVVVFFLLMAWLDLFTHWSHFYDGFPFMKSKHRIMRILGYIFAASLIFLCALFILAILTS